ncbi:MAG: ThuA domain-containing protein [Planctomycetia bacterium]|jgi:type 1 glutamine amidotransferase
MKRFSLMAILVVFSMSTVCLAVEKEGAQKDPKKPVLLVFTQSAGYEHQPPKDGPGGLKCLVDDMMIQLGEKYGFEVVCTKDGRIFDGDLAKYDAFVFYTSGDLTKKRINPPMSPAGKKKLLDAIAAGKGFLGLHSATDTFRTPDDRFAKTGQVDPYIKMIGGQFLNHGRQQPGRLRVVSPDFPGADAWGKVDVVRIPKEEWYAMKHFNPDMHVIMVQETAGMKGKEYARPDYPAVWARMHGKGRVFYTSMAHRIDTWCTPEFQKAIAGAIDWVTGRVEAKTPTNFKKVTPRANELKN